MVVAQPMSETSGQPLSPLEEADGSVMGDILSHVMDEYTVEVPRTPPIPRFLPLPQFIPFTLPPLEFPLIPDPRTPSPQHRFLGVIPMNRSH